MRRGRFLLLGMLAGILAVPLLAHAQLYQWRDTNGRVVFSDTPPPPGIPASNIIKSPKPRGAPAAAPAASGTGEVAGSDQGGQKSAAAKASAQKSVAEREADYKKRQADAAEKAQKDEQVASDEKRREEQCRSMRQGLSALEGGQRVRRFNDKGEPYFIEDAERARDVEKIRADLARAKCS